MANILLAQALPIVPYKPDQTRELIFPLILAYTNIFLQSNTG